MLGQKLADHIGASGLLYAAIAYFSFDESFFAESLIDNYPEMEEELLWWLDDIYVSLYNFFENVRKFFDGNYIDKFIYDDGEETVYITGTPRPVLYGGSGLSY